MSGLVLKGVSREFGTVKAVNDVDLEVPNGRFVCLLGPSGCGKPTLLRMIAGLDVPTAGTISIDDEDITYVNGQQVGTMSAKTDANAPVV